MRTEQDLNSLLYDMCNAVGFKYRSLHFIEGEFPNIKCNLEDLSNGELVGENIELLAALSSFFFSIFAYTFSLGDSNSTLNLTEAIMGYWQKWGLKPFPMMCFYDIRDLKVNIQFILPIPSDMYGLQKHQIPSYVNTHVKTRMVHEGNPSGIYVDVQTCLIEYSSMLAGLLLDMAIVDKVTLKTND